MQGNFNFADVVQQSALVAANDRAKKVREFAKMASKYGVSFVISLAKKPGQRHTTVAYAKNGDFGKNVINVATAICHPGDEFDAAEGMMVAFERLTQHGAFVNVVVPDDSDANSVLLKMFGQ